MNKYDFVTGEIASFNKPINLVDGWNWSFYEHIRRSFLYKNSQFEEANEDRDKRPFKNIVRPVLNIQYRTEGFDVKDIELYVNNPETYYKSFLVKKFHEKWVLKHEIDTFIDELVESYVDYGGTLVKNVKGERPEVVDLRSIAFCDQTDILSGAFAIRHYFSPQQLRDMAEVGWGDKAKGATIDLELLIQLSENEKQYDKQKSKTPGKYIEVFELHGTFPESWLKVKNENEEKVKYIPQIHIIAYYKDQKGEDTGVTLFAAKEPKLPFKFLARDKVYGRALGFGGVEELFEPQIWTNFAEIQMQEMLELASKVLFKTTDPTFKTRNNVVDMDQGLILDLQTGTDIAQLDTTPRNLVAFNNSVALWEQHAQQMGAAGEALLGEAPSAGTPFKLQELITMEAKSLHKYRQGKIAVFVEEIYREWILPHIAREIVNEQNFFAELSADELQAVSEAVVNKSVNDKIKERILNGELIDLQEIEIEKVRARDEFLRGGNKRFIKILKGEFENAPLDILTNIAGKQKNLALLTDKMVNVLRQFIATPQIRQDPEMVKLLNQILESSGMSPIFFGPSRQPIAPGGGATQPLAELAEARTEELTPPV